MVIKGAIEKYLLLTKNEIRITPITLDDKVCIDDLSEYIRAYKELPQRPRREVIRGARIIPNILEQL